MTLVEHIHHMRASHVGAGEQDVFRAPVKQGKGAGIQGIGFRRQGAYLETVRRQHRGPRQQ